MKLFRRIETYIRAFTAHLYARFWVWRERRRQQDIAEQKS